MPERTFTKDGKQYVEMPGIGTYEVPPDKPTGPGADMWNQGVGQKLADVLMNPEIVSGAASLVPGVGTLAAGGIGAGTSVARDLLHGDRDPYRIGGHAVMHGAVDMIPGGVGKIIEKGAGSMLPAAAEIASRSTTMGRVASGLKALFSRGASGPVANAGSDLLSMELPNGVKIASANGLQTLKAELNRLALSGQNYTNPQFTALDTLIKQVDAHLASQGPSAIDLASQGGIQGVTTAAQRAEQAAATAARIAKEKGASIANRLRLALGVGSGAKDAAGY